MGELVEASGSYDRCAKELEKRKVLSKKQLERWRTPLRTTYDQVLALHQKNWNGIWFRIMRNFFRSATAGEFDLIVGNPPWVRWSKLPDSYRERAKPTCEQYDIFSDTPHHGGNELDISGIITYTTADKWLRLGGKLAVVITQTHFQSPSSQGFRRFRIKDSGCFLEPLCVDDLKALKPFPEAANKTSVVTFRKGRRRPKYPVPYRLWSVVPGETRQIPTSMTKSKVLRRVAVQDYEATPVGGDGSPWAILAQGRFAAFSKIRGKSDQFQGRKGITVDLNGVYFVRVEANNETSGLVKISTRPKAGRTKIGPARKFWVEPDLLYPLLKGAADFQTCYVNPCDDLFALIPNIGITQDVYEACEDGMNSAELRKTKSYFKAHERFLIERSTWRKRMSTAPYYAIYNVGSYTFAPFKVVWAEQSRTFEAAVVGSKEVPLVGLRPYTPDHKVYFVEFKKASPAYFLCGLLASWLVKEFVESHNISIQVGDIFKHMRLPSFNAEFPLHRTLAGLVRRAHQEDDATARARLVESVRSTATQILES